MNNDELITYYRECKSIKECAQRFDMSHQTVRRLLILAGEYSSPMSERINTLYDQGYTAEEIAKTVKLGIKSVQGYIPYTKGKYMSAEPTVNALRIRACREQKKKQGENA